MVVSNKINDSASTDVKTPQSPVPSISLPKGGGAIRGIGEKFAANPVTGTGSMTVPIATSPGRSGFGPQLSLSYDSGAGNGPFGFGWSLSLPQITRKTDKGLPRYLDGREQEPDSDVFILSGAEDLVPEFQKDSGGGLILIDGKPVIDDTPRTVNGVEYNIRRYRPRIEGLFARIERWTNDKDPADVFWRSISKDNITTWYGKTGESRIADPADSSRVFSWLICESCDDKGNVIVYEYKQENADRVFEDAAGNPCAWVNERNRERVANRYLKRICYGNHEPYLPKLTDTEWPRALHAGPSGGNPDYFFEVVFDYEDGHYTENAPDTEDRIHARPVCHPLPDAAWPARPDPFSTYRGGFEVRTYRLCQRVLMFHHFPDELGVPDYLVRSTDFTYSCEDDPKDARNPIYSFLQSVSQSGYTLQDDGSYLKKSLPPLEFGYTKPDVRNEVCEVDAESLENLPVGLDGALYQWTDLHGEGIPGILTEQVDAWFYKRNISPASKQPVEFGPQELVALKPTLALAGGHAQFMDLAGDGQPDLVVLSGPIAGLFEHDEADGWQPFRPFTSCLNYDMRDPNLRFVDLDGDGRADIFITEDDAFIWHASLAEEGFEPARRVIQALDEEKGPRLVFADGTQSIHLADLSGDGLSDLVRICNGEVCYWPNLGYGRFGAKITMDNSPWFDAPELFDERRIRLADIDGSGTTDIIYLHGDGVRLYFNQSGNSWSPAHQLPLFPQIDNLAAIQVADLLGNGTACLVWSSSLPGDTRRQMRYVDLMGGKKPHLLIRTVNNLGAETCVEYAPSTKFYLKDKQDGTPWVTRLPFPVHVVERVEIYDHISRNRFVTRYSYHHGHFDGVEREFRGFGRVDQWDTEEFGTVGPEAPDIVDTNWEPSSFVPPVLTRTWFHTGACLARGRVSDFFAGLLDANDKGEYYREPGLTDTQVRALLLEDTVLPAGLTLEEECEACRALKGMMLRREVYADDAPPGSSEAVIERARRPYTVLEQNFTIECLQPRKGNRHAVFFTHSREVITYHYERNPADPRTSHALTLEVDRYGNVLRSVAVAYPRAGVPERQPEQNETHVTLSLARFANRDDERDWHRAGLPVETRTYEVVKPPAAGPRLSWQQLSDLVAALVPLDQHEPPQANTIPYEMWDWRKRWNPQDEPGGLVNGIPVHTRLRLIEQVQTIYRKDDLTVLLPLGKVESLALPGEGYTLIFTPGLLGQVFKRRRAGQPDENLLPVDPSSLLGGKGSDEGGYVAINGNWWIPSGRIYYSRDTNHTAEQELAEARAHFFLPRRFSDPFGHNTLVDYDGPADLAEPRYDLLVTRTADALSNTVMAINDYRVLQPRLVTDPNRNRTAAVFDALGLVVATAVMGKEGENLGDLLEGFDSDPVFTGLRTFVVDPKGEAASLLGKATTRIVYDLERYSRSKQPPFAATLAREMHFHDGGSQSKIQISFSYSDGFGREVQKKIQAEAGEAPQRQAPVLLPTGDIRPGELVRNAQARLFPAHTPYRWVGSGRTVFNNKGKPVRKYEPFFSSTHLYEPESDMTDTGVSPVLFYDPLERVVVTLHPNHTYEKVVFDPWQQTTYDVNDTVAAGGTQTGDPRTDPDIVGFVEEYFKTQPAAWQTWYAQRIALPPGNAERDAAQKAAKHADTPTVAHLDTLGRTFLTLADNGPDPAHPDQHLRFATRIELDIEGNQRAVIDAKGRVVMRYDYDIAGPEQGEDRTKSAHQASMEAGERWVLNDVTGKPIRTWDSRGFFRRMTYDELRRPMGLYVNENGVERLAEQTLYGEAQGDAGNNRTRVYQVRDGAGRVTNMAYDFKGNLLQAKRELLPDYRNAVDWTQDPLPNDGTFISSTTYDALNRPLTVTTPDGSIYRPTYSEANLLEKVAVNLRGAPAPTLFVADIDYNAKGQRERIEYGCGAGPDHPGVTTTYQYDPETFRLIHLKTVRPVGLNGLASQIFTDPAVVQDLHYTYDPAGNITRLEDVALKTVFHDGERVDPVASYTYDALYRLIEAKGHEHIGQTAFALNPPNGNRRDYPLAGLADFIAHPNDTQRLRNYIESYVYDPVGNFELVTHSFQNGGWNRHYEYQEDSLIEPGLKSNRLSKTWLGNGVNHTETYAYTDAQGNDVHGCMTAINNIKMVWDFEDQLQQVELGGGGTAYYVYDAGGQRVRKVIDSQNGVRQKERIYVGGFEVYREFTGNGATVQLERESLHVMDDKQRIALVETRTVEDGNAVNTPVPLQRYQIGNHLGSASVELDQDGALISYEEYHPYGTAAFQAGRSAAEVSLKRYRYTGKTRDEDTGLFYYGARYYAAWLGRWTSADPIGIEDALVLYLYVNANPLKYLDMIGTESSTPDKIHRCIDIAFDKLKQVEGYSRRMYLDQKLLVHIGVGMNIDNIDLKRIRWECENKKCTPSEALMLAKKERNIHQTEAKRELHKQLGIVLRDEDDLQQAVSEKMFNMPFDRLGRKEKKIVREKITAKTLTAYEELRKRRGEFKYLVKMNDKEIRVYFDRLMENRISSLRKVKKDFDELPINIISALLIHAWAFSPRYLEDYTVNNAKVKTKFSRYREALWKDDWESLYRERGIFMKGKRLDFFKELLLVKQPSQLEFNIKTPDWVTR